MRNAMLKIASAGCLFFATTGVAAAADGPAVYRDHCSKCHGETGKADTWRGLLSGAQDFTESNFQRIRSDQDILEAIEEGPRFMPSFDKSLTAEERNALVGVVRAFGKPAP